MKGDSNKVKFGIQSPIYPWDLVLDLAIYCEKIGFDTFTIPDHTVYLPPRIDALEAWTTLAAIAMKTKRVKLGSIVSDVHEHHPVALAQMVATVDIISNGRVIFGIGAGEGMNLDPYGIKWDKPVSRMHEAIKIVKELWISSPRRIDYEGKFYRLHKACLLKPLQNPHAPIWVAGNSERTIKITAELADGWIPVSFPSETYDEYYKKLQKYARQYGRDPSSIEPAVFLYFVVAKNDNTARDLIKDQGKAIALMLPRLLKHLGYDAPEDYYVHKALYSDPDVVEKLKQSSEKMPFEGIVERMHLWGSPDKCIERIEEYIKSGVKSFVLRPQVPTEILKPTVELFAEKVLPCFRE